MDTSSVLETATVNVIKPRKKGVRAVSDEMRLLVLKHRTIARAVAKSMLKKWRAYSDEDELYSVVDLALCEAAINFDPQRGTKFSTWFFYYLKGRLVRELISKAVLEKQAGPGSSEKFRSVPLDHLDECQVPGVQYQGDLTLAVPFSSSGIYYGLRPDERLYRKQLWGMSRRAVERLSGVEKEVVHCVYREGKSLADAAEELGYSRAHVSRVHNKAIKRLRRTIRREGRAKMSPCHDDAKCRHPLCKCSETDKLTIRKAA